MKRWFNRRWPTHRLCLRPWCWRVQTYDYRCHRHQDPPEPPVDPRLFTGLAGFCEHGVGMLDQCNTCCPPAEVTR